MKINRINYNKKKKLKKIKRINLQKVRYYYLKSKIFSKEIKYNQSLNKSKIFNKKMKKMKENLTIF